MSTASSSPMTTRERFRRVMHWEKPDRVPNCDFGYWDQAIERWHREGLPAHINTHWDLEAHLGLEGVEQWPFVPANTCLMPAFEHKVIEDKGDHLIIRDFENNLCEILKHGACIPKYLEHGLKTRQDWERYKNERLDPTREDRIGDIRAAVDDAHSRGLPIRFNGGSLYGWIRNWMGVEHFSIVQLEEPEWVEEMVDHLMALTLHVAEKTLPGVEVDVAWWWEDMCFNRGPLMAPRDFERILVPRYREITQHLRRLGVDLNVLDCDGRIYELVPGWLRGGITCMFPIEAAHTDPLVLRERHGDEVLLMGGVDKIALINGRDAIDRELERLHPLVQHGGYIPTVDHRVPPDVSYEDYLYYLEKKKEIL